MVFCFHTAELRKYGVKTTDKDQDQSKSEIYTRNLLVSIDA